MIKFIQKYQKFFYIVITTVIVISFSFFGTYGSMTGPSEREVTAFVTMGGESVTRGDLEAMTLFINSDAADKMLSGPQWGANFLNNGVIQQDFLENGLASILIRSYPEYFKSEIEGKHKAELHFRPYVHPTAPYISADGAWRYFAPGVKNALESLQMSMSPFSEESLKARTTLYLSQKNFPALYLAEVLRRQEGQYEWVKKDPAINPKALQMFGYGQLDDWFGARFTRMVAEFIFNAAEVASAKGYKVTREEAWADLLVNGAASYQELSRYPEVASLSRGKYIGEQLRVMGMDKNRAIDLWQKVLLFRRLFHDIANGTLVAPEMFKDYSAWANASVQGKTYNLPLPLRFSGLLDLAELEIYLENTSSTGSEIKLSSKPLAVAEIRKKAPELLEKRARVRYKSADKKDLEARISMKETLDWESDENNFKLLKKEFADLGIVEGKTVESRIEALDSLPGPSRQRVDRYARSQIVNKNKDWADKALATKEAKEDVISVRSKGGAAPLKGINDRAAFLKALDGAKMGSPFRFSDKEAIYEIELLAISPDWEVVSFEEARENGSLTELLNKKLEPLYAEVREKEGKRFKTTSGTYKPFEEVKREVAELWLEPKLARLKKDVEKEVKGTSAPLLISETLPGFTFVSWAAEAKRASDKTPYIAVGAPSSEGENTLPYKPSWTDQFKWRVLDKSFSRRGSQDYSKLFSLKAGETSDLLTPANGDIQFVEVESFSNEPNLKVVDQAVIRVRELLGNEGERAYMKTLVEAIKEKGGISFNWMNAREEVIE